MLPKWNDLLYLASGSSRRRELLKEMKLNFRAVPSHYCERGCRKTSPEILSIHHALGKAQKAVLPFKARFVLGGDTIVWFQGRCLGKPKNRAQALRMLRSIQGKKHAVYTGLALLDRTSRHAVIGYAKTDVWIKKLSEAKLREYRDAVHPYDKAGGYAIQADIKIVRKIRGSYSNVVGLPKELLFKMLMRMRQLMKCDRPILKTLRKS
ncbi:MAG TPA: nucleoside triphosphate pyrophosphatase [Candidatus Omnitrophota bacterium]|nr:nucleoside triphosphate pyrophosphatase [Candidatus Omnitrophota bacterium]